MLVDKIKVECMSKSTRTKRDSFTNAGRVIVRVVHNKYMTTENDEICKCREKGTTAPLVKVIEFNKDNWRNVRSKYNFMRGVGP